MYAKVTKDKLARDEYDNYVLGVIGVVAFIDSRRAQWFNTLGDRWFQDVWNLDPNECCGFSCLSEFLDFYDMEACSQKEALEFLEDCKKRLSA